VSYTFDSKSTLERTFDALLGRELRKLNTHLPRQRRTLEELLTETNPTLPTVDGSVIVLKKEEIGELAKLVPQQYHHSIKLPLIILRRMELGRSIYTISGDKTEEFTVKKILGKTNAEYHAMHSDNEPFFLYRPDVSELVRRFHSLVVIGFGIPKELSDYALNRI
jgi:uncharacterized protein (UPF0216 family)